MPATQARAARTTDRVNFVDEDDGRGYFLGFLKEFSHSGCAHTYEHLDEFRAIDGEERNPSLTGHRARQERLAGTWRAYEQHAARDLSTQTPILLWLLEEFDDLFQIALRVFLPGNVGKLDRHLSIVLEALGSPFHELPKGPIILALRRDIHAKSPMNRTAGATTLSNV